MKLPEPFDNAPEGLKEAYIGWVNDCRNSNGFRRLEQFGHMQWDRLVPQEYQATINDCIEAVSSVTQISPAAIKGRGRRHDIARARMLSMALAEEITGYSSARIGRKFNRDHTTVLYAIKRTKDWPGLMAKCRSELSDMMAGVEAGIA